MPRRAIPFLLIKESGVLAVTPNANFSAKPPAYDAAGVLVNFDGFVDLIVDGGVCEEKNASTVVDLTSAIPRVIWEGVISKEELDIA